MSEPARGDGCLSFILLVVTGIIALALAGREETPPKPSPPRVVYVHTVTTHVVHSGMPGWGIVVVAVVALGVLCALFLNRS